MPIDDEFEPHLGRMRARGLRRGRKYLSRILAAANLARGGSLAMSRHGFSGSRTGRAAGVGRMLASRDRFAAFRQRRVIIKSRIVRLAGKGAAGALAHLRYVQRDGVTRDGAPGALYGPQADRVDGKTFLDRGSGDRHQFRFIVSAEDGTDYEELKSLTRRLMVRVEEDLGTKLDWVAVDHFNTAHPHSHIIVRGVDERGKDLVIARDYLSAGMRERAAELVDLDLGPRSDRDIEQRLRAEIGQERLTSIDRTLLRDADVSGIAAATGRDAFDQSLRAGRLAKLGAMGLARPLGAARWRLDPELAQTLRGIGERGDIIRTMQREFTARALDRPAAEWAIAEPGESGRRPIIGRVIARGLADEHADRHFLIIDATDGRTHYVGIGKAENVELLAEGSIVRVEPLQPRVRESDRTIARVATASESRYSIDAHLKHDPGASEQFAQTHIRRLEAMRRLTSGVEREADGSWNIAPDHLDRVAAYERARLRDRPVAVTLLSPHRLDRLVDADAATWLDREFVAPVPEPLRDAGFGHEVREAQARRRQWLIAQGFAEEAGNATVYRAGMLGALQRRELLRVAGQLSDELKLPFAESPNGARVKGIYRRPVELTSGRFALIQKSREFTLVPWRPALDRQVGKSVVGIIRENGISWSIGRGRGGPTVS